jgi:hypothetical protein
MSPLTLARRQMAALSPSAHRASYTPIGSSASSYSSTEYDLYIIIQLIFFRKWSVDLESSADSRLAVHYNDPKFIHKIGKGSFGKVFVGEWVSYTSFSGSNFL